VYRRKDSHKCSTKTVVKEETETLAMREMERDGWKERAKRERDEHQKAREEVKRLRKENEEMARRIEQMGGGGVSEVAVPKDTIMVDETIDVDQINYQERFSYSLEHYGKITALVLLDHKYLGFTSNTPGQAFYFASADALGTVKIWDLDQKESLQTLTFQEELFSAPG
jgi:FtsZ-binding cell division protein ZapB